MHKPGPKPRPYSRRRHPVTWSIRGDALMVMRQLSRNTRKTVSTIADELIRYALTRKKLLPATEATEEA